jgi:hypothetical protein
MFTRAPQAVGPPTETLSVARDLRLPAFSANHHAFTFTASNLHAIITTCIGYRSFTAFWTEQTLVEYGEYF